MTDQAPSSETAASAPRPEAPVRAIPWRRLLLEGGVIVASILLAFGIDAWWGEWQETKEEARLIQAVLDDARANLALIEQNSQYHRAVRDVELQILQLAGSSSDVISAAKADSLIADLLWWLPAKWNTGALETLVAGGRLEAIDDDELRRLLTSWQSRILFTAAVDEQEEVFFNEALMPFLRAEARVAQIAQLAQALPGGAQTSGGSTGGEYGNVDWWTEKRDHRPLLMSEAFQNVVLQKYWIQSDILGHYDDFSRQLNELIGQLEAGPR